MADFQRETPPSSQQSRGADINEQGSPRRDDRRRSRSPRRERGDDKPRRKDAGFKWKEKRRDVSGREERDSGLQRGYRDHYGPRSRSCSPRPRSPRREEPHRTRRREWEEKSERDIKPERKEKKEKKPELMNQQPMIIVTVNDRLGTKKAIPCFASDSVSKYTPDSVLHVPLLISKQRTSRLSLPP